LSKNSMFQPRIAVRMLNGNGSVLRSTLLFTGSIVLR
jgi:hypothetical protein